MQESKLRSERTMLGPLPGSVTIAVFVSIIACGPGVIASGGSETSGTDETGAPQLEEWAEIRCIQMSADLTMTLGRPIGSADSWVGVIPDSVLSDGSDIGQLTLLPGGWADDSCAAGIHPESSVLSKTACYWLETAQRSVCYAGGDSWFTLVNPECATVIGGEQAWPDWLCGGEAGFIGGHPWDSVTCSADSDTLCAGIDDGASMWVWPTCWLDEHEGCVSDPGDGDPGDGDPDEWPAGEAWGPCPLDTDTQLPTLCNDGTVACVPANDATANMCLPFGECPRAEPPFGISLELGVGDVCYPRCDSEADCVDGMICAVAGADMGPMCAWPV